MFTDEDLDDKCSVENERYFLFHVKVLPQNTELDRKYSCRKILFCLHFCMIYVDMGVFQNFLHVSL